MPRRAREESPTGMYHVYSRGTGKQNIYESKSDYIAFLDSLYQVKIKYDLEIHGYCLMPNHFHVLMVQRELSNISAAMHRLLTYYSGRFNYIYDRSGVLFGNRYGSVPVVNYSHYVNLIKYMHYNPVKAEICGQPSDYPWSSFSEIIFQKGFCLTDREMTLKMYNNDMDKAKIRFLKHHENAFTLPDIMFESGSLSMEKKVYLLEHVFTDIQVKNIASMCTEDRNAKIIEMRKELKLTVSQIERLTGISRTIVKKICSRIK